MTERGATGVPRGGTLGPLGDLAPEELRAHLHRLADWVADYRAGIGEKSITPSVSPGEVAAMTTSAMPAYGEPMSRILDDLDAVVMPGVLQWGHPRFLGYFGSTSNGPALLGEIAAAAMNVSAMTWKTSPAATELETVVLQWIQRLLGIAPEFMGIVYDTASVALVHALAVARERAAGDVRRRGLLGRPELASLRVYCSDQAHSSIEKAMVLLGLGESNVVRVPSDEWFRLDVDALATAMRDDVRAGSTPMAVVATVGTTSTASVDPVRRIAALCAEHGAWLHVDAAYGGALSALPDYRHVLDGVELADSIVVNPHKWLFVPLDFSCLYVRDPAALRRIFSLVPEYLEGDSGASGVTDYMDYGIQLGRRFRALKAWMTFRAMGSSGIQSRIAEHVRLASLLAEWITREPDAELVTHEMAIVCFRMTPHTMPADRADALNLAIAERVNATGDVYLTHTRLRGRVCLRAGFGNVATTEDDVRIAWDALRSAAQAVTRDT